MTAQRKSESGKGSSATAASGRTRKPWKKKTPFDVILAQEGKLDEDIASLERQLEDLKAQKAKLAEARAIFEG